MKALWSRVLSGLLVALPVATAGPATEYVVSFEVVTLTAAADGPYEVVSEGSEGRPVPASERSLTDVVERLRLGETTLDLMHHELLWNGGTEIPATAQLLSAPRLVVAAGGRASARSGSALPYMTRNEAGCLEVEFLPGDYSPGVVAEVTVSEPTDESGHRSEGVTDVDVQVKVVIAGERLPLEGVPFDVGKPVLMTREVAHRAQFALGRWGLLDASPMSEPGSAAGGAGTRYLLVLMRVDQR